MPKKRHPLSAEGSFIHQLNYENTFNSALFSVFKADFHDFLSQFTDLAVNQRMEDAQEFLHIFQHILFLLMCDSEPSDYYRISPQLSLEEKTDLYFDIREMSENLLRHVMQGG